MKIWNEHGTKIHVGLYTVIFYKHHAQQDLLFKRLSTNKYLNFSG